MNDIRLCDWYLTEAEQNEWKKRNSLYNSVWFYVNKGYMPDIEYSDTAVKSYRKYPFFSDWQYMYKYDGGKVLVSPFGTSISADLMTGWWNPFKAFTKMSGRNELNERFLETIPSDDTVLDWLVERSKSTESESRSLLNFLDVVYTVGNMIPAPINWIGQGPDTWDYKLNGIMENKTINAKEWNGYIEKYYYGNNKDEKMKDFISKNYLEMYFDGLSPRSLFGEKISWTKAKCSDWKVFFDEVTNCIVQRNSFI